VVVVSVFWVHPESIRFKTSGEPRAIGHSSNGDNGDNSGNGDNGFSVVCGYPVALWLFSRERLFSRVRLSSRVAKKHFEHLFEHLFPQSHGFSVVIYAAFLGGFSVAPLLAPRLFSRVRLSSREHKVGQCREAVYSGHNGIVRQTQSSVPSSIESGRYDDGGGS
jgi:hypothetical protein